MPPQYVEANRLRIEAELRRKELELKSTELQLKQREQDLTFGKKLHISPTVGGILVAFIAGIAGVGGHYWDWFTSRLSSADNLKIAELNTENARLLKQLSVADSKRHDTVEFYISMLTTLIVMDRHLPKFSLNFLHPRSKAGQ